MPARRGIDFKFKYDRKTVEEFEENGKIVLRAAIDGAVKFEGEKIRVDNHLIVAGEDINVGFYALDSNLKAKKIIMDPIHGKIIGGSINAEIQVVTGVIGNKSEKKTYVTVSGFDRVAIKKEFEQLLEKYKVTLAEVNNVKQQIELFERNTSGAEYVNSREYNQYLRKYEDILDEIRLLDEYRKRLQQILQIKGEGAIDVSKAAYPETYIEIKKMQKKIDSIVSGSFYALDNELHNN